MDDFPPEPRRFWIALGLLLATFALAVVMSVFLTVKAHAQQMLCAQGDVMIRQTIEVKKQLPVWEGVIPVEGKPPAEVVLTQSEKGEWSLFILGDGKACLVFVGDSANPPIQMGKGT